MGPAV
ncbi:hypothetical protein VCHC56A1_0221, partial [Vibrio cholerae HC-56A1]